MTPGPTVVMLAGAHRRVAIGATPRPLAREAGVRAGRIALALLNLVASMAGAILIASATFRQFPNLAPYIPGESGWTILLATFWAALHFWHAVPSIQSRPDRLKLAVLAIGLGDWLLVLAWFWSGLALIWFIPDPLGGRPAWFPSIMSNWVGGLLWWLAAVPLFRMIGRHWSLAERRLRSDERMVALGHVCPRCAGPLPHFFIRGDLCYVCQANPNAESVLQQTHARPVAPQAWLGRSMGVSLGAAALVVIGWAEFFYTRP